MIVSLRVEEPPASAPTPRAHALAILENFHSNLRAIPALAILGSLLAEEERHPELLHLFKSRIVEPRRALLRQASRPRPSRLRRPRRAHQHAHRLVLRPLRHHRRHPRRLAGPRASAIWPPDTGPVPDRGHYSQLVGTVTLKASLISAFRRGSWLEVRLVSRGRWVRMGRWRTLARSAHGPPRSSMMSAPFTDLRDDRGALSRPSSPARDAVRAVATRYGSLERASHPSRSTSARRRRRAARCPRPGTSPDGEAGGGLTIRARRMPVIARGGLPAVLVRACPVVRLRWLR